MLRGPRDENRQIVARDRKGSAGRIFATVQCTTWEQIIEWQHGRGVDFVKVDVEWKAEAVFRGFQQMLKAIRPGDELG